MKRLIFLKVADANPDDKKMKAAELVKLEDKALASAIKSFKDGIKPNKDIKVIQEIPEKPQVVIEFPEAQYHPVHDLLRSIGCVEIIDAILPLTEAEIKARDKKKKEVDFEIVPDAEVKKLKAKMAKYTR